MRLRDAQRGQALALLNHEIGAELQIRCLILRKPEIGEDVVTAALHLDGHGHSLSWPLRSQVLSISSRREIHIQLRRLLRLLLKRVEHDDALGSLRDVEHPKRAPRSPADASTLRESREYGPRRPATTQGRRRARPSHRRVTEGPAGPGSPSLRQAERATRHNGPGAGAPSPAHRCSRGRGPGTLLGPSRLKFLSRRDRVHDRCESDRRERSQERLDRAVAGSGRYCRQHSSDVRATRNIIIQASSLALTGIPPSGDSAAHHRVKVGGPDRFGACRAAIMPGDGSITHRRPPLHTAIAYLTTPS